MPRKFLKGLLLGTLILSSSWTIVSCENTPINNNDNNDDQDNIDESKQVQVIWSDSDSIFVYKWEKEPDVLSNVSAVGENGKSLTVKIAENSLKLDMNRVGRQNKTFQAFNGDKKIDSATMDKLYE